MKQNKKAQRKNQVKQEQARRQETPRVLRFMDCVAEGILVLPNFIVKAINLIGAASVCYLLAPLGYLSLKLKGDKRN